MQNKSTFQVYNASAGSGKTFTLVKEYLKVLFLSENDYFFQNILAITFTNKAAAEMKERVISNLREFSMAKKNVLFTCLIEETKLPEKIIQKRAKSILNAILQNYAAFNINTIDTFTYKLIRTFALDLDLSTNFDIEMDTDIRIHEAVENVISKIGVHKNITEILIDFALQQADEDKSWDIASDLRKISKIILNENDINHLDKIKNKKIRNFINFRKSLKNQKIEIEKKYVEIGFEGLKIIENSGLQHNAFFRSMLPNHFVNLSGNLQKVKFFDQSALKKRIDDNTLYSESKSEKIKLLIRSILPDLLRLYNQSEDLYQTYNFISLLLNGLTPLAVLSEINKALDNIKEENNIKFIAEFNQIISKYLIEQPAAFIYERIGEKFKHYFIDEMQDTSILQWHNLIPLISNALSQENSGLLLVGDAKQSIYRWRGGKPEQFMCLASKNLSSDEFCTKQNFNPFYIPKDIKNLETNFRSYPQIINFNNNFFTYASKLFIKKSHKDLYKNGNHQKNNHQKGGYVNIDFIEGKLNDEQRNEIIPEKVAKIIYDLDGKINRNEICILVKKNRQGETIANYLSQQGISIVSSDTLLLKNDKKVNFIINLLYYLSENEDKNVKFNLLYFLHQHLNIKESKHFFISQFIDKDFDIFFNDLENYNIYYKATGFAYIPLYENIEKIIRCFHLTKTSDAYLQFFLDEVFTFSQQKSQSTIEFLEYWELKKDKLSIAASENKNAVKISSIHKSKGLEYKVVIFPYNLKIYDVNNDSKTWINLTNYKNNYGFETFYVDSTKKITYTGVQGQQIFQSQLEQIELDNFNLLYVAFTRAVEQLYIITENEGKSKNEWEYSSDFLKSFLKENKLWEEGKFVYEFGTNTFVKEKDNVSDIISIQQEKFISSPWQDHQITIVANSALLWDNKRGKAIQYGNVIHEIMSKVIVGTDLESTINKYISKGVLNQKESKLIKDLLVKVINHNQLKTYFLEDCIVYTEREILNEDKQILIPDRLNFHDNNKVTIIDYKTGNEEKKHFHQINSYAKVLETMNFIISKKLLVYINQDINIVEV